MRKYLTSIDMEHIDLVEFPPKVQGGPKCLVGRVGAINTNHKQHGALAHDSVPHIHALLLKRILLFRVLLVPVRSHS